MNESPASIRHEPTFPPALSRNPSRYHRLVGQWSARHPGRSWLDEDFVRFLEQGVAPREAVNRNSGQGRQGIGTVASEVTERSGRSWPTTERSR